MFENIGKNLVFKYQNEKDKNFLFSLYSSTREDELNMTLMNEVEKRAFLKQQFDAKEFDYSTRYEDAEFLIIYRKKKAIGRVVFRITEKVHLVDIAFIKKFRSLGFGKEVLNVLISHAKQNNKPFELSVAKDNIRALKLYKKLGFQIVESYGYYYNMKLLIM
ncbi:GNAT family N-acetyltransferase [Poseidonibacter sp.]|uniref:GNAT family N-acetyltransferase n=1 Tax=Poseidonibacter sp. TaxID=2321188 RepID=UPI003C777AC1